MEGNGCDNKAEERKRPKERKGFCFAELLEFLSGRGHNTGRSK